MSKRKLSAQAITFVLIVGVALILAFLVFSTKQGSDIPRSGSQGQFSSESTQELRRFSSTQEMKEYIRSAQNAQESGSFELFSDDAVVGVRSFATGSARSAEVAEAAPAGRSSDFSTTNVQVEGVDEADIVKNDGKYVYTLTQDKLVIIDAFPAEDSEILSETEIDGTPHNFFINGDRLVVFSQDNVRAFVIPEYEFEPRERFATVTRIIVFDISDRSDPEVVKSLTLDGIYFQSRMIGDDVYIISKEFVYYAADLIALPAIREQGEVIVEPDVFYFDNPERSFVFHTIASLDLDLLDLNAQSFLMGHSNTLFVSENNIYVTYQKNLPYISYKERNEERFFSVVVPLLPGEYRDQVQDARSLSEQMRWDAISSVLESMYGSMTEQEKKNLIVEISEATEEYDIKQAAERQKTIIQKIAIDDGNIEYRTRGEVPGTLLNQFSIDEYDGNLRVATTTSLWTRNKRVQHNNVYVMDEGLSVIGEIEGIAPDESIFSTRFIQDRLYMVTFERIDPLFVIDLSDPRNPEILGELKIPGFSDYLHPYDKNHIIGVGKETGSNQWGGVSVKGVKLSLFDVSDVENPRQVDTYEIGESGTDSEALRDHKAFLFDREKNVLVIPVREVKGERIYERGYYSQRIWHGAYVFSLTPENGFELKGTIAHLEGVEDDGYYWGSPSAIRRSLYIDDVLYTVSQTTVKANDLNDLSALATIDLPYKFRERRPQPYPIAVEEFVE